MGVGVVGGVEELVSEDLATKNGYILKNNRNCFVLSSDDVKLEERKMLLLFCSGSVLIWVSTVIVAGEIGCDIEISEIKSC